MKALKYGYFGEDKAQQIFLENYLQQLPVYLDIKEAVVFERDKDFKLVGHDRPGVIKVFAEAVIKGLSGHQQDLFFVGVDLDSDSINKHKELYDQMTLKIFARYKDRTFIFIPVQCVEHWLLYLKFKKAHPDSNKNEVYESIARPDAKKRIYGNVRPVGEKTVQVVTTLTEKMEIEWLVNRSYSFRHFHSQVANFLNKTETV